MNLNRITIGIIRSLLSDAYIAANVELQRLTDEKIKQELLQFGADVSSSEQLEPVNADVEIKSKIQKFTKVREVSHQIKASLFEQYKKLNDGLTGKSVSEAIRYLESENVHITDDMDYDTETDSYLDAYFMGGFGSITAMKAWKAYWENSELEKTNDRWDG